MCCSPSASRTYSTKSVEFARRTSPVRWSSVLSPDEPGHEMDAILAQVGVRVAIPVEQRERRRRAGDRPLDDVPREQHATGRIGRQAGLDQPAAHLRPADLHADLGQHALRLVDDPVDEIGGEHLESWAHHAAIVRSDRPVARRPVARDDPVGRVGAVTASPPPRRASAACCGSAPAPMLLGRRDQFARTLAGRLPAARAPDSAWSRAATGRRVLRPMQP